MMIPKSLSWLVTKLHFVMPLSAKSHFAFPDWVYWQRYGGRGIPPFSGWAPFSNNDIPGPTFTRTAKGFQRPPSFSFAALGERRSRFTINRHCERSEGISMFRLPRRAVALIAMTVVLFVSVALPFLNESPSKKLWDPP